MGTSGTECCEGCLQTRFKDLPPQLALKLSLVRLPHTFCIAMLGRATLSSNNLIV